MLTAVYVINGTIARPEVDISAGLYFEPINVDLNCATADTTIVYTIDGTDPVIGSSDNIIATAAQALR